MSINKFAVSVALAGILGASSALAENEGSFVGGQLASSWVDTKISIKSTMTDGTPNTTLTNSALSHLVEGKSGSRFGVVYGKYYAIDEDMGYRAYGLADLGDSLYNVNANMDFLYTFVKFEKVEVRGFVGAYVGGVFATFDTTNWWGSDESDDFFWGIDAGLNLGARFVIAQRHGIDLFYRYGLLEPEAKTTHNFDNGKAEDTWKIKQSSSGIRYTFSF